MLHRFGRERRIQRGTLRTLQQPDHVGRGSIQRLGHRKRQTSAARRHPMDSLDPVGPNAIGLPQHYEWHCIGRCIAGWIHRNLQRRSQTTPSGPRIDRHYRSESPALFLRKLCQSIRQCLVTWSSSCTQSGERNRPGVREPSPGQSNPIGSAARKGRVTPGNRNLSLRFAPLLHKLGGLSRPFE